MAEQKGVFDKIKQVRIYFKGQEYVIDLVFHLVKGS